MQYTPNFEFELPESNDYAAPPNDNFTKVDTELVKRPAVDEETGKLPESVLPLSTADAKDTPVDADSFALVDSADSNKTKRLLWSQVKAVLGAMFAPLLHGHDASNIVSGILPITRGGTGKDNIQAVGGAVRRTSIVGSSSVANIGWFPVGVWSVNATYQTVRNVLSMTGGNGSTRPSGMLEVLVRTTNISGVLSVAESRLIWIANNGYINPSNFALVNDTTAQTVTLYQYIGSAYEYYHWSVIDESSGSGATSGVPTDILRQIVLTSNYGSSPIFSSSITPTMTSVMGARNLQSATGSYVGTGTYGPSNKNSVTVGFRIKFMVIRSATIGSNMAFIIDPASTNYGGSVFASQETLIVTISGTGIEWYNSGNASYQQNTASTTYNWMAIGLEE